MASALSMPPFDLVPVLFLTFPLLVWLLDGAVSEPSNGLASRFIHGFKPGFAFGFGYFLAGLWWIGSALLVEADTFAWALPFAVLGIPFVLAIFWGFATAFASLAWNGNIRRIFMLAACLTLMEYLRGFIATGFPWNAIGYAAYPMPLLMQSASVLGIYAMTAFVVLVFSLAATVIPGWDRSTGPVKWNFGFVMLLVVAHVAFGFWRMPPEASQSVENVSLRLVQPAIPQAEKFSAEKHQEHLRRYLDLSTKAGQEDKSGLSGTTHLIWPESVFPYLLTERKDTLASIAAMLPEGTSLITGAARSEDSSLGSGESLVFNSVYVIDDKGVIVSAADKVHLVPFGEFLPMQSFLESLGIMQLTKLEGGFEPGASRKLLGTGTGPEFLPLICYEIIFSGDLWGGEEKPGFILNLTNDAWFGNTPGPYQHERQSVLRAVEGGIPLIRVANNGISGVYDSYGRSLNRLELNETGIIDSDLPIGIGKTVLGQYGREIFVGIFFGFLIIALFPVHFFSRSNH